MVSSLARSHAVVPFSTKQRPIEIIVFSYSTDHHHPSITTPARTPTTIPFIPTPTPPFEVPAPDFGGAAVLLAPDGEEVGLTALDVGAAELLEEEEAAAVVLVIMVVDTAAADEDVSVTMLVVPVVESSLVAERICVGTAEEGDSVLLGCCVSAGSTDEDMVSAGKELACVAAEDALAREAEAEFRGMMGMGRCVVMSFAVELPAEAAFVASEAIDVPICATVVPSWEIALSAVESGAVAEPATLDATTASCDAADEAAETIEFASFVALEATDAGVGATMLTGAMVTGPVGIDALAGS